MVTPHSGEPVNRLVVTVPDGPPAVKFAIYSASGRLIEGSELHPLQPAPIVTLDTAEHDDAVAMGKALLAWITSSQRGQEVWDRAVRQRTVADVVLDIRPPALRMLPWEMLCDGPWTFRSSTRPGLRARYPFPPEDAAIPGDAAVPLRILVVQTGTVPEEADVLGAVHRGLRVRPCIWQVEALHAPTMTEFTAEIDRFAPHVLHVVGHGEVDAGPQSITVHPHDKGMPWNLDRAFVEDQFTEQLARRLPRLVVLACCTKAAGPHDLDDLLLNAGADAVISMQGAVTVPANDLFVERLYRYLADGMSVHCAVASARNDVHVPRTHGTNYLRPRLAVAREPRELRLRLPRRSPVELLRKARFVHTHLLIDQSPVRGQIIDSMLNGDQVTLVRGRRKCGKTSIVKSCIVAVQSVGRHVIHVQLPNTSVLLSSEEVISRIESRALGKPATSSYADLLDKLIHLAVDTDPLILVIDDTSRIYEFAAFREEFVQAVQPPIQLVLVGPEDDAELDGIIGMELGARAITIPEPRSSEAPELATEMMAKDWTSDAAVKHFAISWEQCRAEFLKWARTTSLEGGTLAVEDMVATYYRCRSEAGLPLLPDAYPPAGEAAS
jgi:CHAT domain